MTKILLLHAALLVLMFMSLTIAQQPGNEWAYLLVGALFWPVFDSLFEIYKLLKERLLQ